MITSPEKIAELYELPAGSVVQVANVLYAVLGSSLDQKCYEPINKRHRTNNKFFCLDGESKSIPFFRESAKIVVKYKHEE